MADYSDRSGVYGTLQPQIYPAADEIVKRQRNEALDRIAVLEADLNSANAMIAQQSAEIVRLATELSVAIGFMQLPNPGHIVSYMGEPVNRASLTDKQRADLDAANSSVQ